MKIINESNIVKLTENANVNRRIVDLVESPVKAVELQIDNLIATYGPEVVSRALAVSGVQIKKVG